MRLKKRFSGKLIIVVCIVLFLGLTQTVAAKKCWVDGNAYLGIAEPFGKFITTYQSGPKGFVGSLDLTFITADWTLFGSFPTAVSGTTAVGAWKRTGNRTFDWTWIAYAFDEFGEVVYIIKPVGTMQVSRNCMSVEIFADMKLYAPDQDPLGDEPPAYGCVTYPGAISMRLIEVGKVTCD
jgi:hypothetical protein